MESPPEANQGRGGKVYIIRQLIVRNIRKIAFL